MIENTQPNVLFFGEVIPSYSKVSVIHSVPTDEDAVGKAFWKYIGSSNTPSLDIREGELSGAYVLEGLVQNTAYRLEGCFYDAMIDADLLAERVNISISAPRAFVTKEAPYISNLAEVFDPEYSDVGVRSSNISIELGGYAENYVIEVNDGTGWEFLVQTPNTALTLTLPAGTYSFRTYGKISLTFGGQESSEPIEYGAMLAVTGSVSAPTAPFALTGSLGRIQDTFERYDLKLSWEWDRASGGNLRTFIIKGILDTTGTLTPTKTSPEWDAPLIQTSVVSANSVVLTGIPQGGRMFYRVEAIGYDEIVTPSEHLLLIANEANVDTNYVKETGIEVNYAHILAYTTDSVGRHQTFKVDAATGEVSIGKVDPVAGAPITVDPETARVTVRGSVVTDNITAASFVMTQLSSTDRPHIRTANKSNYEDGNPGMYMGYNGNTTDPKFQWEIGDYQNYIKWTGSKLSIKGDIEADTLLLTGAMPDAISDLVADSLQEAKEYSDSQLGTQGLHGSGSYIVKKLTPASDAAKDIDIDALAGRPAQAGDILTYVGTDELSSDSYLRNANTWDPFTLKVNGNAIINGTLATEALTAASVNADGITALNVNVRGKIVAESMTFVPTGELPDEEVPEPVATPVPYGVNLVPYAYQQYQQDEDPYLYFGGAGSYSYNRTPVGNNPDSAGFGVGAWKITNTDASDLGRLYVGNSNLDNSTWAEADYNIPTKHEGVKQYLIITMLVYMEGTASDIQVRPTWLVGESFGWFRKYFTVEANKWLSLTMILRPEDNWPNGDKCILRLARETVGTMYVARLTAEYATSTQTEGTPWEYAAKPSAGSDNYITQTEHIINSNNFKSGKDGAGWAITREGKAEFNDVVVRGRIEALDGVYGGAVVRASGELVWEDVYHNNFFGTTTESDIQYQDVTPRIYPAQGLSVSMHYNTGYTDPSYFDKPPQYSVAMFPSGIWHFNPQLGGGTFVGFTCTVLPILKYNTGGTGSAELMLSFYAFFFGSAPTAPGSRTSKIKWRLIEQLLQEKE